MTSSVPELHPYKAHGLYCTCGLPVENAVHLPTHLVAARTLVEARYKELSVAQENYHIAALLHLRRQYESAFPGAVCIGIDVEEYVTVQGVYDAQAKRLDGPDDDLDINLDIVSLARDYWLFESDVTTTRFIKLLDGSVLDDPANGR